jgi:hypothetical protein
MDMLKVKLLVYVHKHTHSIFTHVYSATGMPYAIASSILLVYHLGHTLYISVSQPPSRGPVPGPGINYTGPQEVNIL